jgi:hypothetical protein
MNPHNAMMSFELGRYMLIPPLDQACLTKGVHWIGCPCNTDQSPEAYGCLTTTTSPMAVNAYSLSSSVIATDTLLMPNPQQAVIGPIRTPEYSDDNLHVSG